jgi:RNA polymerase sigma-70 factor (ECF subfamily)
LAGTRNKNAAADVLPTADAQPTPPSRTDEHFRSLAESQLPRLYGIARRLVGDDAEDAVQDALVNAYRAYARLEHAAAGPAWLTSILVNVCRDRRRALARRPEEISVGTIDDFSLFRKIADEDPFPYSDSLHLDFLARFDRDDVRAVLRGLPELYRVPLVLVHADGFATKEVARILDAPLGTVLARLHRGRKLFERRMWEYAEENGLLEEGAS